MKKFLALFILFLISLTYFLTHDNVTNPSKLYDIAKMLVLPSFAFLIPSIWNIRHYFGTYISLKREDKIRVSFAYLIRIKVKSSNGIPKYLLVKNSKIHGYQPPGGVYQYYDKSIHKRLGTKDHLMFHKEGDLRLELKRKDFPRLLDYFKSKEEREIAPNREFIEELIETNILDNSDFFKPKFKFVHQIITSIEYSKHFQIYEKKIFDIYNLELSEKQIWAIKELMRNDSSDYKFASESEIITLGCSESQNSDLFTILPHTPYLIK